MPQSERFTLANRRGARIVGLLDYPAGDGPVGDVLVACHGYGGDKDGPYLRRIAATLTAAGIAVVRFDFTNGAGESDGTLADASVAGYADDLEDVLDEVARRPRLAAARVSVAGHSYAGMVVLVVAARRPAVAAVLFLSALYDRTADFDMPAIVRQIAAPIYVVHGAADESVPLAQPEALRRAAGDRIAGWLVLPDADHNYRTPGAAARVADALRDAILALPARG
ncbi:MAG TPA: alpha/beta fold hydrolase [Thermomicrobiales bacterium]|nr:alpha/beta fold hydrolase [Thermomicrobiales bacterium]